MTTPIAWQQGAYWVESERGEGFCAFLVEKVDEPSIMLRLPLLGLGRGAFARGEAKCTHARPRQKSEITLALLSAFFRFPSITVLVINSPRSCLPNFSG